MAGEGEGVVFDIQHYAVTDGPGIRTLVFLKGCPLRCAWCCNPESQRRGPDLRHSAPRCRGCFACEAACPGGAVSREGGRPVFDRARCCPADPWACVEACPQGALSRVGEAMSADRVMARVAADRPFYDNSGGGVTFSGGEPFAQASFLRGLLERSRSLGIHAAVETCGCADASDVAACAELVNLFLFDLKSADPACHEALTGASNDRILRNLRFLSANYPDRLLVRVPLVPGFTDSPENLSGIAGLLVELRVTRVELMPYHELGRDKYKGLARPYPIPTPHPADLAASVARAVSVFRSRGIDSTVGGE